MQLAAFKGPAHGPIRKLAHWAVCFFTGSPWSHVELVIDGMGYSARVDGGVGPMVLSISGWDVFDLPPEYQTPEAREKALAWFSAHLGEPYDWFPGILRFAFPKLPPHPGRYVCTGAVASALGVAAREPGDFDPGELVAYFTERK